jgi:hypothetical protein
MMFVARIKIALTISAMVLALFSSAAVATAVSGPMLALDPDNGCC